jgi:hypothetical protein
MSSFENAIGKHIVRMGGLEGRVSSVTIFPSQPDKDGFLEWIMKYEFATGGGMTIGAIQREPNGPVEFHS